jgi:integrase
MPYRVHPPGRGYACWYVRGTDAGGRFERSTGQENRRKAQDWADEFVAERARSRVPGAGAQVGFSDAAEFYKAFKNPSKADIRLIDAVARHFGDTNCRTIVHAQLVAAANVMKPGRADSTKNRKVIVPAAAVLHYASKQKWCEYQRIEKFEESRLSNREPATDETVIKLLEHIEDPPRKSPLGRKGDPNLAHKRLLIAMLYELGLRITDLLQLEWRAIDLPACRVMVRIAKTDRKASLQFSEVIAAMLANLPVREGRLFPWSTRRGVYAWLSRLRDRAGVYYTPHQSRHTLASDALAKGIPDKKAAELGVWADPRSLHRYQHVRPDAIPGRDAGALLESAEKKRKAS